VSISQPALSRSIRTLEDNLGVKLFDRTTHRVTPTSHFDVLLGRAKSIIAETNELERELEFSKGPNYGELSIAMGAHAAEISGSKTVTQLALDFPKLSLLVDECYWQIAGEQVLNRSVEIGYANTSAAYNDRLEVETIASHEPVFFCHCDHPLLAKDVLSDADMRQHRMVKVRFQSGVDPRMARDARNSMRIEHRRTVVEVSNLTMARTIVKETDCFGMATPLQLEPWLNSGEFKILPYSAGKHPLNYGFITLRERSVSPAGHEFMKRARLIEVEQAVRNRDLIDRYTPTQR
jgi:DNA-binding transcriptional LysR family regulator